MHVVNLICQFYDHKPPKLTTDPASSFLFITVTWTLNMPTIFSPFVMQKVENKLTFLQGKWRQALATFISQAYIYLPAPPQPDRTFTLYLSHLLRAEAVSFTWPLPTAFLHYNFLFLGWGKGPDTGGVDLCFHQPRGDAD